MCPHSVWSQLLCRCEEPVGWQRSMGEYSSSKSSFFFIFTVVKMLCYIMTYDFCVSSHSYSALLCFLYFIFFLKLIHKIIIYVPTKIAKKNFFILPLQTIHLWAETIKCGKTPAGTNTGTTGGIQTADSLYNNSFS